MCVHFLQNSLQHFWNMMCVIFFTESSVFSNQNIFRTYKHVSKGQFRVLKEFSRSDKFHFLKTANLSGTLVQLDETIYKEKVNIFCLFALWMRFPPYKCIHGPGEDPFEAVMCTVGAASQISIAYRRLCFVYKTSIESQQEIIYRRLIQALHCFRDLTNISMWKHSLVRRIFLTMEVFTLQVHKLFS